MNMPIWNQNLHAHEPIPMKPSVDWTIDLQLIWCPAKELKCVQMELFYFLSSY